MRKPCIRVLVMLVVQYALGVFLNLYVTIPASDHDAGFAHEVGSAPLSLTLHALLGLALIAAAIAAVVRSVAIGSRELTLLAAAGLTAIFGAFAAGEIFVRDGSNGSSMVMALLAGVALLCYVGALTVASMPGSEGAAGPAPADEGAGDEFIAHDSSWSAVQYGIIEEYDPASEYGTGEYSAGEYGTGEYETRDYEMDGYQPVAREPVSYGRGAYEPADYEPVDYEPSLPMPPTPAQRPPQLPRRQPQGQPMPGQPQWSEPTRAPLPGQSARHQSHRRQPDRGQPDRRRPDRHLPEHWQPEQWQPDQDQAMPDSRYAPEPEGWPAPSPRRPSGPYRDE
jgi:hypothetical protein